MTAEKTPYLLTLQCPSCGGKTAFFPDSERLICQYCGNEHIFQLPTVSRKAGSLSQAADVTSADGRSRPLAPRPPQVKFEKTSSGLKITRRWFSPKYIGLGIFCFVWDAFLCFWYGMAFNMPGVPWIMIVFPLGHLAVGVGLTYTALAGFLNTTTIRVDGKKFTVQHDPLPWPGEVKTDIGQLDQLYCQEKRSSGDNGDHYAYQLSASLKDGRKLNLVSNLESPDVAAYMEQQLETWLRIPDRAVAGEYR